MKKTIQICAVLLSTMLFSGCAIKQDDSILTKGVKHTVNAPLYAGMVIAYTPAIVIVGTKAITKKVASDSSDNQLEKEGDL